MVYFNMKFFIISLLINQISSFHNKYCQLSCDYGTVIQSHTVCNRNSEKCGPDPRCGPDFQIVNFSNNLRQYILDLHNYYRNKIGLGNETRGNQPPAANMRATSYDKELEFIAQCWANTCNGNPLLHDTCRRSINYEHVGQNLGYYYSTDKFTMNRIYRAIKNLINLWYEEVENFKNEWIADTQIHEDVVVGHYTQLLWADTYKIGCAAVIYTNRTDLINNDDNETTILNNFLLVCNYGPGGNYLGRPVYEIGQPASQCPHGFKPNYHYRGLCGEAGRVSSLPKKNYNIFQV